ncbi:MAG: c-type cytochrome [Chloroflexota bacterium]
MFGTPDLATALVLGALAVFFLLALLSYHNPRRPYVKWGIGLLVFVTAISLLSHAFDRPGAGTASVLVLVVVATMLTMTSFHSRGAAHGLFWIGVALVFLALPLMGAGRGDLAMLALIAGPGVLMLVAALHPHVPAFYSRIGSSDPGPTDADLVTEGHRYTRLAAIMTVGSLAAIWLFGGVPRGEVVEAATPLTIDQAAAERGAGLFQQYGCVACHSVTSTAPGTGPALKGLGNKRERLDNGTSALASDAYIQESILNPDAKTVAGYSKGVMAAAIAGNQAEIRQSANLRALVEYIKSLK